MQKFKWDKSSIESLDSMGMRKHLEEFPEQCMDAIYIGERINFRFSNIKNIVIAGLGGSAIGGDILRSYLASELSVPIFVNRNYTLPEFVGAETLLIVNSYSGNTEETLNSYKVGKKRKANIVAVASGGILSEWAKRDGVPLISIPKGFPPRAALGYSFFPMLLLLIRSRYIKERKQELEETISLLRGLRVKFSLNSPTKNNLAKKISLELFGKLPVIYSSSERLDAVTTRWRNQLNENSKVLSYSHLFPELNHNEIVGWEVLKPLMKKIFILCLRDREDHPRVKIRMDITRKILEPQSGGFREVKSIGKFLLSRIFSLIYTGDYVSFYLAMLNKVDPTPVVKIDYLKARLENI